VSQASFEPPGAFLIAVAKTAPLKTLMQVGDRFRAQCVAGGVNYQDLLCGHFCRRFPPGCDRFEGVGHFGKGGPPRGGPVLSDRPCLSWVLPGGASDGNPLTTGSFLCGGGGRAPWPIAEGKGGTPLPPSQRLANHY